MHLLWPFTHIYYCVCAWALQTVIVDGFCLLESHSVHVSCLCLCCRPEDIKGGACFPLHLSSSFGRGLYFRMPIWSAAVPRTSSFTPPPLALFFSCWSLSESCTVLFSIFKLVTTGEVTHNGLLACIQKWHSRLFRWTASPGRMLFVRFYSFSDPERCFRPKSKFTLMRNTCPQSLVAACRTVHES